MHAKSLHTGRWRAATISLAIVAGIVTLVVIGVRSNGGSAQGQKTYAKLWPAFTMTYSRRMTSPVDGAVIVDETHRLVVTNEYAWRDDVVRDAVHPKEVGSYRELKDGVITQFSAERNYSQEIPLGSVQSVTAVTSQLDPSLLPRIQSGRVSGWQDTTPTIATRLAKRRLESAACAQAGVPSDGRVPCPGGATSVPDETRLEFDSRSLTQGYVGGVAVFGERKINGKVTESFVADSITFR